MAQGKFLRTVVTPRQFNSLVVLKRKVDDPACGPETKISDAQWNALQAAYTAYVKLGKVPPEVQAQATKLGLK